MMMRWTPNQGRLALVLVRVLMLVGVLESTLATCSLQAQVQVQA